MGNMQLIYSSSRGHRRHVFSVKARRCAYSFVHLRSDESGLKCNLHSYRCHCRQIVDAVLPDLVKNNNQRKRIQYEPNTKYVEYYKPENRPNCLSHFRVPVPLEHQIPTDHVVHQDIYDQFQSQPTENIHFKPRVLECANADCDHVHQPELAQRLRDAVYLTMRAAYNCTIYYYQCPQCDEYRYFDGIGDHVLWANRDTVIAHEIFNNFDMLRDNRLSQSKFVEMMRATYARNRSIQPFPHPATFKKYYVMYNDLVNWHHTMGCRRCKALGQLPRILGIDGTGQCVDAAKIQHIRSPKDSNAFKNIHIKMKKAVLRTRTVMIPKRKTRVKLLDYLLQRKISVRGTDKKVAERNQNFEGLRQALIEDGHSILLAFLEWFRKKQRSMTTALRNLMGDFLRNFSAHTMLIVAIPYSITTELSSYSVESWPIYSAKVLQRCPPLWDLINQFHASPIQIPQEWIDLIQEVAVLSRDSVHHLETIRNFQPPVPKARAQDQALISDPHSNGCDYSSYECQATRPTYDFDSERKKKNKDCNGHDEINDDPHGDCNKYYQSYQTLSNGIMAAVCGDHDEAVGYHVLRRPESVNDIFSLILMIYPHDQAPEIVICDHSCSLQRYCMYREPTRFKHTMFLNDTWHGGTHLCGPYLNFRYWKQRVHRFTDMNDSQIEQLNSKLEKVRLVSMYMALPTFADTTNRCLEKYSRKAIQDRTPL